MRVIKNPVCERFEAQLKVNGRESLREDNVFLPLFHGDSGNWWSDGLVPHHNPVFDTTHFELK